MLEDRRVLAAITVTSLADNLFVDGAVSLREAIQAANTNASVDGSVAGDVGADTILFDPTLFATPQTITLGGTELVITEALSIDATSLASNVTIDGDNASRIFNIIALTGDFTLAGLTLTGGRTTGNNVSFFDNAFSGGAIRSLTIGSLTIDQSTVSGNITVGLSAQGGGIFSNGAVTFTSSTVNGNSTVGDNAVGGGVSSSVTVTLTDSTVSGNNTEGDIARGGGIFSSSDVNIINSTVSGNSTSGSGADGGGIAFSGDTTLINSTVTNNRVRDSSATGGGIWNNNDTITIANSIIADNVAGGGSPDIRPGIGVLNVDFSLIEQTGLSIVGSENIIGMRANLGPLANNGGPTETHALLVGSPAIDAGDPAIVSPPPFDQRGAPFARVFGSRIDIGAVEDQPGPDSADFDADGDIDGADFLAWQRGFGTPGANRPDGDADNDNNVDAADLSFWESQFSSSIVVASADFDRDNDIDGADFLAWQRGFGTPAANRPDGDANNDNNVDAADLSLWESQFGSSNAVAASTSADPPAAATAPVLAVQQSLEEPENVASLITTSAFSPNILLQLGGFGQSFVPISSQISSEGSSEGSIEREKDKVFHDLPDRRSSFSSDLLNSGQTAVAVQALATAEPESRADKTVDHAFEQLTDDALTVPV